jgi:hypothetical protein
MPDRTKIFFLDKTLHNPAAPQAPLHYHRHHYTFTKELYTMPIVYEWLDAAPTAAPAQQLHKPLNKLLHPLKR